MYPTQTNEYTKIIKKDSMTNLTYFLKNHVEIYYQTNMCLFVANCVKYTHVTPNGTSSPT